ATPWPRRVASLNHKLKEVIGPAVVKPVHHPARLYASGRWVVAQYLYGQPLIHDLADHFRTPVRQHHTSVVVEAAKEHAYLLPNLVDEDHRGARLADRPHELAQRLGHQPRLEADVRIAHLALQFGARDQGGHGVHHDDIDRAGP